MSVRVEMDSLRKTFPATKRSPEVTAVETFSLDVAPGELVTLLGPSGCGKTTVLRMLAGFEDPSSGKIRFDTTDITRLPANRRNSAMVFQSYALFPHMTVEENVAYGLKFREISSNEKQDRLKKMLELVGLTGLKDRRPGELSGGQQQRVALARALVIEPGLLLFDEPLCNLDAKLREYMRSEIRKLQKKLKITAIYVTHDQSEAMAISDRVVVMNLGKVEQVGTPQEIYLKPATRFVADFMGAANFLSGQLGETTHQGRVALSMGPLTMEIPAPTRPSKSKEVTVVVRPEHIHLASSPGHGLVGVVRDYQFLGSHHEYVVEMKPGERITVHATAKSLEQPKLVGDSVFLSVLPEQLHLIPSEA